MSSIAKLPELFAVDYAGLTHAFDRLWNISRLNLIPGHSDEAGIYYVSIYIGPHAMPHRTAKLFVNGGSQAVRLPADFRFPGSKEVYIRRDSVTGEVILSAKPGSNAWSDFFALRNQTDVPPDFMAERLPANDLLQGHTSHEER